MTEPNQQFDDLERHVSNQLRKDLRGLFEPPGAVPAKADKTILDQARRQLAKPRHIIIRLRWAAGVTAAAAVIALGMILFNVVTPDFDPGPQSRLPRFARNDTIRNPQSVRLALAEGRADIDGNGRVDILDAFRLARSIEARGPADPQWDLNSDGRVDKEDVDLVASAAVRLGPGLQARQGETIPFEPVRVAASSAMTIHGQPTVSCHSRAGGNPATPRLSWTPAFAGVTKGDPAFVLIEALGDWGVVELLRSPLGKGV